MLRKIPVCLLFCLVACTIIPDDTLEDFPSDVRVNQLTLRFLHEDTGENKYVVVKPVLTSNKIEINWPVDIEILFYNKSLVKTIYQLNTAGFATKITTSFSDGKEIIDEIVYDGANRVIELKNSFFNDSFKFYYSNNQLDSISKIRTLPNMTTQAGFFKRIDDLYMVSIFPFNKAQSYTLNLNFHGSCACTPGAPVPNELNKTSYSFLKTVESYYTQIFTDMNYTQFLGNQYCKQVFSNSVFEGNRNFYGKPTYMDRYASFCYSEEDSYLNSYLLFPEVIPDSPSLFLATVDSEVRWMKSNAPKTSKWNLMGVDYTYAPFSK
ncbi:MAG: hypothetical protein JNM78_10160 [Cyclobacteriaceae bacterium]|nr:hypothetical protein [Cyclobacteriaceae bacterium]